MLLMMARRSSSTSLHQQQHEQQYSSKSSTVPATLKSSAAAKLSLKIYVCEITMIWKENRNGVNIASLFVCVGGKENKKGINRTEFLAKNRFKQSNFQVLKNKK